MMVIVTANRRLWLIGMAVSLAIFGVLYFTVIKPSSDTANQAIKTGLQQSQQVLNQAQKQISSATTAAGTQAGAVNTQANAINKQAQKQISSAEKLTACVAAAGTDIAKVQACQSQFSK
jgi:hypothetical protein